MSQRYPLTAILVGGGMTMTFVVLPLSAFPGNRSFDDPVLVTADLIVHTLFFGVPIALAVRKFHNPNEQQRRGDDTREIA